MKVCREKIGRGQEKNECLLKNMERWWKTVKKRCIGYLYMWIERADMVKEIGKKIISTPAFFGIYSLSGSCLWIEMMPSEYRYLTLLLKDRTEAKWTSHPSKKTEQEEKPV
ncbi:MAG: hypothetical protein ACKO1T_05240 [Sediminibacterium sp.]